MTWAAPWLATQKAHWAAAGGRPAGKLQDVGAAGKGSDACWRAHSPDSLPTPVLPSRSHLPTEFHPGAMSVQLAPWKSEPPCVHQSHDPHVPLGENDVCLTEGSTRLHNTNKPGCTPVKEQEGAH